MKVLFILLLLCISLPVFSQPELITKADQFLVLLDEKLKAKVHYTVEDDERLNWHFVPRARHGASFHDFTTAQQNAALALLKASLSAQGYEKATAVIALENVLRIIEDRGKDDTYRDPQNYYFTIFGTPSANGLWGWRIEGHHVAFNFTAANGQIESSTPSFLGANPAIVPSGNEQGKQVLKLETALGFALVNSFSPEQLKIGLIAETAPAEILSYNKRKAGPLTPAGISYSAMTAQQQKTFLQLLDAYVKNYQLGFSAKLMEKIKKAGIENLTFAWAGSLKPGIGHYYRIQGPMLLIEYDNTQNNANHVHSVVRDLTNDFGEDILREHYERKHR